MTTPIPIFALGTVLFPGGILPLRVFEARYVDMIRRTMRDGDTFGVCLIRSGSEVGPSDLAVETIGCRARIDDWNMEQLGVLEIVAVGTERFTIASSHVERDGLLVAEVDPIEPDAPTDTVDEAHAARRFLARIVTDLNAVPADTARPPIPTPYRLDDAVWVGNRLAELLPLPAPVRQTLMAVTDANARLTMLAAILAEHGIE